MYTLSLSPLFRRPPSRPLYSSSLHPSSLHPSTSCLSRLCCLRAWCCFCTRQIPIFRHGVGGLHSWTLTLVVRTRTGCAHCAHALFAHCVARLVHMHHCWVCLCVEFCGMQGNDNVERSYRADVMATVKTLPTYGKLYKVPCLHTHPFVISLASVVLGLCCCHALFAPCFDPHLVSASCLTVQPVHGWTGPFDPLRHHPGAVHG
jgi:hypothetical protein